MEMEIDIPGFVHLQLLSESATHSPAPHSPDPAALLALAGISLLRPHALPGTPITVLASAVNYSSQV